MNISDRLRVDIADVVACFTKWNLTREVALDTDTISALHDLVQSWRDADGRHDIGDDVRAAILEAVAKFWSIYETASDPAEAANAGADLATAIRAALDAAPLRLCAVLLCPTCGGNGVLKIPGGVSECPQCQGRCWA